MSSTAAPVDASPEPRPGDASAPRADSRSIHRIPARLVVSQRGMSASLGTTRDISLQGMFIETDAPFAVGTVLPLSLDIGGGEAPLVIRAEVVRREAGGMGLRFDTSDPKPARRLRRWIVDKTSVQGTQKQIDQLHDASAHIEPIRAPERVRALLEEIRASGTELTLVPPERVARDQGKLVRAGEHDLSFAGAGPSTLTAGEDVYALATLAFVSYAFSTTVLEVDGKTVRCALPELVVYSERRTRTRSPADEGTRVRWPAPWSADGQVDLPVVEWSDHGLSFRVPAEGCLLTPGAPLLGAELVIDGQTKPLTAAEVRHLTPMVDEDGTRWLRVGVSTGGAISHARRKDDTTPGAARRARSRTPWGKLRGMVDQVVGLISYRYHKSRSRITRKAPAGSGLTQRRLTIPNGDLPLRALLEQTRADGGERLRCPLVIVAPGFAGRKEQMSFLAGTLREGFSRAHQDVAVLRFDGSNNLGESGKDPGCESDGLNALHYSTTGVVKDMLSVLAWARHNPFIEPTHIVLVSVSMGSVGARHVLTRPDAGDIGLWVSYMGAPDAINAVLHVSGNIDMQSYWDRGEKLGFVSIGGVLIDGDKYWADLMAGQIGDLDAARREMGRIRADVMWVQGKHDAWMDPRRVTAMMEEPAPGAREYVEVESGHLPRRGDVAIAQFVQITQRVWQHVHGGQLKPFTPALGRLAAAAEAEWADVRREPIRDRSGWWRDYLLDADGPGFDVLEYDPEYTRLMDLQADLLAPEGATVLELGAGTGNLSRRILGRGVARLVSTDLVPEALDVVRRKLDGDPRASTQVVDLEGTPLLAMRRWLSGDLPSARQLAERIPAVSRPALEQLIGLGSEDIHAALLGRDVDVDALVATHRLGANAAHLLTDLHALARVARAPRAAAPAPTLRVLPASVLDSPGGLPFADGTFDAVGMSLVLSYLTHPDDILFEAARVLKPGGRLVLSSMLTDSESSKLYLDMLDRVEAMPDDALPAGVPRHKLLDSVRKFVDHAGELFRLEEEGLFRFYDGQSLGDLVRRRGFTDVEELTAFGHPPQAVIITCRRA